ncbi:ankyrin [Aspergillus phoenicis ATCC 13157]|uniref:Ankyrin n=1 Tax=Aspergillus phoenicis ATCC 13157 TaxID=1353007 RepID=A0A370PBN6_ASPPH|nr:ankyrin [Aspergillus phoenicis ATCC 13157]
MAEALSVVGGIASISQIVSYVISTTKTIIEFCRDVQDAPKELFHLQAKLSLLGTALRCLNDQLLYAADGNILPLELQTLLQITLKQIDDDVSALQKVCDKYEKSQLRPIRRRVSWALLERKTVESLLQNLRDSEASVNCALNILNLQLLLATNTCTCHNNQSQTTDISPPALPSHVNQRRKARVFHVDIDTWLRRCGLFGSIDVSSYKDSRWQTHVRIGYKFPSWLLAKSVMFSLRLASARSPGTLDILPGSISIQNRVPSNSPFMSACRNGDVKLMRQLISNGTGSLAVRTYCTGDTPLFLAIQSQNLDAIKLLLDEGADPNLANDGQVLPVFFLAGLRPGHNRYFPQLPPVWECWLDALRLLVNYGASINEVVRRKSFSMLNLVRADKECPVLELFQFLLAEGYYGFHDTDENGYCAVFNALQATQDSLQCLKLLRAAGVSMNGVFEDGRSILHLAAEFSYNVGDLEFIYDNGGYEDLNRQDKWGWTPLHYAVTGSMRIRSEDPLQKVKFLLEKGADCSIQGRPIPHYYGEITCSDQFNPADLAREIGCQIPKELGEDMESSGETFHDAVQYCD